jgi:hypothetical protein
MPFVALAFGWLVGCEEGAPSIEVHGINFPYDQGLGVARYRFVAQLHGTIPRDAVIEIVAEEPSQNTRVTLRAPVRRFTRIYRFEMPLGFKLVQDSDYRMTIRLVEGNTGLVLASRGRSFRLAAHPERGMEGAQEAIIRQDWSADRPAHKP